MNNKESLFKRISCVMEERKIIVACCDVAGVTLYK